MQRMNTQELISALADGELGADALADGLARLSTDEEAREAWRDYHLIGDVLRSADLAPSTSSAAFMARLSARLVHETPPSVQPVPAAREAVSPAETWPATPARAPEAANDGNFRWKLVAGLASAAAVLAVGWSVLSAGGAGSLAGPQLASAPSGVAQQGVMIRDPQLDEFLAAHRQHGDATALQMPAGFLRNATFEAPGR